MITIDLLKENAQYIPRLAQIWYDVLGKEWIPGASIERTTENLKEHLNDMTLPLTFVVLEEGIPIGMCSLRKNDGIRPDLMPWLGSLVVSAPHQNKGIGRLLMDTVKNKAISLGFDKLYLFVLNPELPSYYAEQGWHQIDTDTFRGTPVAVMKIEL